MQRLAVICVVFTLVVGLGVAEEVPRFSDSIEVRRIVVTARVVGRGGAAVRELGVDDFEVVVDGEALAPEAVEWVETALPEMVALPAEEIAAARGVEAPDVTGRLVVLLFQLGMHRTRLPGVMRMARRADELIATFAPEDLVAVLTYDSRLRLRLDFTRDRARLAEAVRVTSLFSAGGDPETPEEPSLIRVLDQDGARTAAAPESALLAIARALEHVPGHKNLVFFAWGMGRFSREGVRMHRDYGAARAALARADVVVHALDVTEADYHSLEVALQLVARDTGGIYARTHLFPDNAIQRAAEVVSGHYLITFASPTDERGVHRLVVRLVGRKGEVHAPSFFDDSVESAR